MQSETIDRIILTNVSSKIKRKGKIASLTIVKENLKEMALKLMRKLGVYNLTLNRLI